MNLSFYNGFALWLLAGESIHSSNEEVVEENEAEEQRRRKRNKSSIQDPGKDETPTNESSTGPSGVPEDEGGCISKNKKRKQKKKRHKEKLMAMGLMRRAAPLDFTYTKDKEEDNKRRATELSDFLRTTKEIYMSDCKYQPQSTTCLFGKQLRFALDHELLHMHTPNVQIHTLNTLNDVLNIEFSKMLKML